MPQKYEGTTSTIKTPTPDEVVDAIRAMRRYNEEHPKPPRNALDLVSKGFKNDRKGVAPSLSDALKPAPPNNPFANLTLPTKGK